MSTIVKEKLTDQTFSIGDSISIPRYWQVITTDSLNEVQVSELAELPHKGDSFLNRDDIKVTSITGQKYQTEGKDIWDITVTYSKNLDNSNDDGDGNVRNTGSRLISMNHSYRAIEKPITHAYDNSNQQTVPVQNTAGCLFSDPITHYKYNPVLRWTQRENNLPNNLSQYLGTINSGGVTVIGYNIPAKQGLLRSASPTMVRDEKGDIKYDVTYEIEVDREEHKVQARNTSFVYLKNKKKYDIRKGHVNPALLSGSAEELDEAKEQVNEPQDIDKEGALNIGGKPLYLTFRPIGASSWGGLNLISRIS